MTTTYTIRVPACQWLTANKEQHHYTRSAAVRAWREAVNAACRQAKLPTGITPVRIHADIRHAETRPPVRDRLNLAPTIKALVDGLGPPVTTNRMVRGEKRRFTTVGYGLLPDDSDKHVIDTTWTLERSYLPMSWVDLRITHEPVGLDLESVMG